MNVKLASAVAVLAMTTSPSARAQIAYTGLGAVQFYEQSSPTTLVMSGAGISLDISVQSASDFTSAMVSFPGPSSPEVINYSPQLISNGTYQSGNYHSFLNIGAANVAYPFGTYTFTATNSVTETSQTASLIYDSNHWPSAAPALTAASYSGLQAMNVAQSQIINFNNFTGDGSFPGAIDPATGFGIFNETTGALVYNSGQFSNTATSYTLPANTLRPGNIYSYFLDFDNADHLPGSPGYYLDFQNYTSGTFTTTTGSGGPQTLANFEGGTPGAPVGLPIVGQIGDITGSIGGTGSTDFYRVYWSGGAFEASMSLTGESPGSSYVFELINSLGNVIDSFTLDQSDGFAATLSDNIGAGLYEVGLLANSPTDPSFNLDFNTPVQGVVPLATGVPESRTWAMMLMGFGLVGYAMRKRPSVRNQRVNFAPA